MPAARQTYAASCAAHRQAGSTGRARPVPLTGATAARRRPPRRERRESPPRLAGRRRSGPPRWAVSRAACARRDVPLVREGCGLACLTLATPPAASGRDRAISLGRAPPMAQAVDYCRLAWMMELLCDAGLNRPLSTARCGPCDRLSSSPSAPSPREALTCDRQKGAQHERSGAEDRKDMHGRALDADPTPCNPHP